MTDMKLFIALVSRERKDRKTFRIQDDDVDKN